MTIFDDNLFLKNYKGVPLIFFLSKFKKQKLKKNIQFLRGGCSRQQNRENTDFRLNQGGAVLRGGAVPVDLYSSSPFKILLKRYCIGTRAVFYSVFVLK